MRDMANRTIRMKTRLLTALVVTALDEKGPMSKSEIVSATGITGSQFSTLQGSWNRNTDLKFRTPFKSSGTKKSSKWATKPLAGNKHEQQVITVEKIVKVQSANCLDSTELHPLLDSIENLRHFLVANQIHTLKVKDGVVVRLMEKGIVFED